MTESKAPVGFIHGFASGQDWRMPMKPLQSGGALVLIGWVLRMLLQSRGAKGAA
jgi:hypothetical protein